MKKFLLLMVAAALLMTAVASARVSEVDSYRTSLTAGVNFWTPNLHGSEESDFWGIKSNWDYSEMGATSNFAPSVLVNYKFDNSGLTFTYDRLSFGGSKVIGKSFKDVPANTTVNVSGYSNIFGLSYNFGSPHIWGSLGVKYFNDQNTLSDGTHTYSNVFSYMGQPAEDVIPFIGVGLDIPVVPGRADLYGAFDYSTPIIGSYYDAKIGVRINAWEGLNIDGGFRTMGWGSDLATTVITAPFGIVDNGSVNYNGAYYGISYYFY